jgi:hypothetical protein
MRNALLAAAAASALAPLADAGFAGFVAFTRNTGSYTVIDVFAAVSNANDRLLNVYNVQSNGIFVQRNTAGAKTWRPEATSSRSTNNDSFMTIGTTPAGYAAATEGDPNFSGTSWNGTPTSDPAIEIPNLAGWYTGDVVSPDISAENMAAWGAGFSRTDSFLVSGGYPPGQSFPSWSSGSVYGVWCAHFVVANNYRQIGYNFSFRASASVKDGVTGATTQATYQFVPAPGAIAALAAVGMVRCRRRAS